MLLDRSDRQNRQGLRRYSIERLPRHFLPERALFIDSPSIRSGGLLDSEISLLGERAF